MTIRSENQARWGMALAAAGLVLLTLWPAAVLGASQAQDGEEAAALAKEAWDAVQDFRRGGGNDGDPDHPGASYGPRIWEIAQSLPQGTDRSGAGEEAVHLMVHARRFEALEQWLEGLNAADPMWEAVLGRLPEAGQDPEGNRMARRQMQRLKDIDSDEGAVSAPRIDLYLTRLLQTAGRSEEALAVARRLMNEHPDSEEAQRVRRTWERQGVLRPGDPVPPFQAETVEDTRFASDSLQGKVVLVDFWSTSCGACLADMPTIQALHESVGEKGFEVLGVAFDQSAEAVRRAVESKGAEWPQVLASQTGGLPGKMGARGTPYYVLIDSQGRIASQGIGIRFLEDRVHELLGDR